jgi:hypothetical protein
MLRRTGTLRLALARCVTAMLLAFGIAAAAAAEVTFELRIENGRVPESMRRIRVKQHDVVKLRWSTDRPMTVHLHGYDIESRLVPGTVGEMTFTARATGRFTIEPHLQSPGAHGAVLVTIEVYP